MRLYQLARATNPRRVIVYLAEKGIELPRHEVDVAGGENRSANFLALNPAAKLPVLELDDGTGLVESAAIVEYLEELYPQPPMIGRDPVERARVRALERIAAELIVRANLWLAHSQPFFAAKVKQQPEVATAARPWVDELLDLLEVRMGEQPFLAGPMPTIADCTLFALFQTCRERFDVAFGTDRPRLDAWYARFRARPSADY